MALLLPLALAIACSQRVTPEDEYAEEARERPLMPLSAAPMEAPSGAGTSDAATTAVHVEWRDDSAPADAPDGSSVLFVFVRPDDRATGPPLAVRRIPSPSIPLTIEIGADDAMIPGTVFPDLLRIEARFDRDGDASTTEQGDWTGAARSVAPGGEARIVLSPDLP